MTKNEAPRVEIWVPQENRLRTTVADIVRAYTLLLEIRPDHHRSFRSRLESDPDAARAEAVVFSWLRSRRMMPTLSDAPGTGGPDYLCLPDSDEPFLIEVTSLKKDAVEQRSGWPDELSERAQSFGMITPNLLSKARAKARQLGGHDVGRVLAICLSHIGAGALLGTLAAEWLMTSEPKLSVPIGVSSGAVRQVTDLSKAAFLTTRDGAVVPTRRSISAILLIAIWEDQLETVGILHPEPAVSFDYRTLREVPFLRLEWPLKDNVLRTEWVVGHPSPGRFYHAAVSPSDAELRGK